MSQPKQVAQAHTPAVTQADLPAEPRTEFTGYRKSWEELVGWDEDFRSLDDDAYKERPEVKKLKELVEKSFVVPAWLADIKSPQYDPYVTRMKNWFRITAKDLSRNVSKPAYTKVVDDEKLSADVEECLSSMLHIVYQNRILECSDARLGAVETDRCHPVDVLGSLVWNFQSDGLVAYRTKRRLQIPHADVKNVSYVRPDACAFIPVPDNIAVTVPPEAFSGLSCFFPTQSSPEYYYLLHWVTEFKPRGPTASPWHQVVEGLVSALYQRRAFGFPDHIVFGTAHHSQTTLEVLAATWVRSEPDNSGSEQELNAEKAVPTVGQVSVPSGSGSQGVDAAGGEPKINAGDTSQTIEDIEKYKKIVVYTIAEFSMDDISSILRLYLLMRHTWGLAQEYQNDIKKDNTVRIQELIEEAKHIYEWASPPPPPPPSDRGAKRRRTSSRLTSVIETKQEEVDADDSMSVDQDDSSDSVSGPQELDSLSDPGPTCRITGEVAKYTLKNYAYEEHTAAGEAGDSFLPEPSTSQTV